MSTPGGHTPGLWPVPGDGVLARYGGLVLLSSLDDGQFVDTLLDLLEHASSSGGDGRQFADAIADALEGGPAAEGGADPSVLAFGVTGNGLAVTVSGGAWAEVTTEHGTARIEASHPGMLMRTVLRSPASGIRGGLSSADNGSASTDRFSRLDAGTVRAGGLLYVAAGGGAQAAAAAAAGARPASLAKKPAAREAPAEPVVAEPVTPEPVAQEPEPAPAAQIPASEPAMPESSGKVKHEPTAAWVPPAAEPPAGGSPQATQAWAPDWSGDQGAEPELTIPPEPAEPFEAVLLTGGGPAGGVDLPAREPLSLAGQVKPGTSSYVSAGPIIQGVYCKNGHFDDPEARFCAICGISMNQQTLVPRPGERPPLGVLLLDDGSVFQLDTDYVVGREPSLDSSVASGKARPLRVADDSGIVSRVHARVHLDGWRVLITDLGSANGTRLQLPGQPPDQALVPQVPVVLATGSQIDLGGRMFRYESHRGR